MPSSCYQLANIVLIYNYIPNCKIILTKFLVPRNQLQEEECFQGGMKTLVIGITQRNEDQQLINCKGEDLFQKSWEAEHWQWETSEPRVVLQLINVHDTNLYSLAYNSVLNFICCIPLTQELC